MKSIGRILIGATIVASLVGGGIWFAKQRAAQAFQFLGGGDIGRHHEFLDQLVRVEAVAEIHRLHPPVRGQDDLAFRQVDRKSVV